MVIQPYLFFEGRCEEAIEFYRGELGAEVGMLMRYKENPDPTGCPDGAMPDGEKVMHAELKIGDATLLVSDGMCNGKPCFQGVSISLSVPDVATADRFFSALLDGGQVQMPIGKTFWSPRFGVVADRFGVSWMIGV